MFVLYLAQRAPIVANPIICERYIKRADMNRGPLLLSHKLNTHFLSSKQDLVCVMHHGCDKTGKSICGILSPTLMEGAHLFVRTLGYYRNPPSSIQEERDYHPRVIVQSIGSKNRFI